jgi:hypothetical protein
MRVITLASSQRVFQDSFTSSPVAHVPFFPGIFLTPYSCSRGTQNTRFWTNCRLSGSKPLSSFRRHAGGEWPTLDPIKRWVAQAQSARTNLGTVPCVLRISPAVTNSSTRLDPTIAPASPRIREAKLGISTVSRHEISCQPPAAVFHRKVRLRGCRHSGARASGIPARLRAIAPG